MRISLVALLLVSVPAWAQTPPPPPPAPRAGSRVELAVRTGFALPFGKVTDGEANLSDNVTGQIPLWLEGGYRLSRNLLLGLYFQYGFFFVKGCNQGSACDGHGYRIGPQIHYHPQPGRPFDPWIGLGVGYESITFSESSNNLTASLEATGWEFANLQAGGDFVVSPRFAVGPFASFSLDQTRTISFGVASSDFGKALHEWLMVGVRGRFDL